MSWEEMSSHKYKCPCGLGTYTVKFFMDDWNRSRESWAMDCSSCKQNFRLYSYQYQDSGMLCIGHRWVQTESYREVEDIETQLAMSKEKLVSVAKSRHMEDWLLYFRDAKSKKEIWRRLTNNGKTYPQLSTFYAHTRHENGEDYLKKQFSYDNLPIILAKLVIKDSDIDSMLQKIAETEKRLRRITDGFIKQGFK